MTAQINDGLCAICVKKAHCAVCGVRTLQTPDGRCLICYIGRVPAKVEPRSLPSFEEWLTEALPVEAPPNVIAYNFNLAEGGGWIVEVIGSSVYDPKDKDWSCPPEAWTCRPSEYIIEYEEAPDWQTALALVVERVTKFLQKSPHPGAQLLRRAQVVCAGFVDGDLAQVWPMPSPNKSLERTRER
jgi:hypothetical protein